MKNTKKIIFVLCCCATLLLQNAHGQDGATLLKSAEKKFNAVKNYKAEVNIKTDVSFIKIVPVNAFIYYKQPDKMHIESKGIAILPKQGPDFLFATLLNSENFIAVDMGTQLYNNIILKIIKLLPKSDTSDLVLGTVWIDASTLLIYKTQVTTKSRGTVDLEFTYGKYANYLLPDKVVFEMDVNKFKIPKAIAADYESSAQKQKNAKQAKRGKVTITYKTYILNNGIDDSVFK
nr:hypothetical protein [Bacteroidota bacterium]